jgi:hypothetical protein
MHLEDLIWGRTFLGLREEIPGGIIEHKWDKSEELRRVTVLVAVHD